MVVHNADNSIMFYYHEEWLYVGRRVTYLRAVGTFDSVAE